MAILTYKGFDIAADAQRIEVWQAGQLVYQRDLGTALDHVAPAGREDAAIRMAVECVEDYLESGPDGPVLEPWE